MKKINNIISSELIVRTNNVKLRQEYGTVGTSAKITEEGNSTLFTTDFEIEKVIYVTLNGINLIEGKHYFVDSSNVIKISNDGSPIKNNPGLTSNILVAYHYKNNRAVSANIVKVAPIIETFYINTYSGKNGKILFDFIINPRDGKNIFWSILKDGNEKPLFSGTALQTENGTIVAEDNSIVELAHFISETEYLARQGENIPFTFVVIYDLSEDGSSLDEKIMDSVKYHVDEAADITGNISITPELVNTAGSQDVSGSYSINGLMEGTPSIFDWKITKSVNEGPEQLIRSGNQVSDLSGTFAEIIAPEAGEEGNIRYYLSVLEQGDADYRILSNDKVIVSVPVSIDEARAGYLDAAIMSYIDPIDNVRKKIGSLGTQQDLIEYNERVPREIFTKTVTKSYLDTEAFISASVNTFDSSVDVVYFVIEIPDAWGPITFYQTLGSIDISAFNKISLGNGYTAYLYKDAPSTVDNPSDYYIKRTV